MMRLIKLRIALSLIILVVFELLGVNPASAVAAYAPSAAEMSLLPRFCQAKLNSIPTDDKLYAPKIGPDWLHLHHYCFGLNFINRYKRSFDKAEKSFYLQSALDEMNYTFASSSRTFWMRPEMHVQKGKLFAAAKRNIEAVREFEQALQENPNYVEAYVALSDLYKNTGQQSKSITAVEQGLERAPNDKSLQRRYNQLTGKIFTPPQPTVEQAAEISATPTSAVQVGAISEVNSTTTQPVPPSPPFVVPEKIGTPSNPYCRFCPPE